MCDQLSLSVSSVEHRQFKFKGVVDDDFVIHGVPITWPRSPLLQTNVSQLLRVGFVACVSSSGHLVVTQTYHRGFTCAKRGHLQYGHCVKEISKDTDPVHVMYDVHIAG